MFINLFFSTLVVIIVMVAVGELISKAASKNK